MNCRRAVILGKLNIEDADKQHHYARVVADAHFVVHASLLNFTTAILLHFMTIVLHHYATHVPLRYATPVPLRAEQKSQRFRSACHAGEALCFSKRLSLTRNREVY